MKYHTFLYCFQKLGKISQNVLSAAVVIRALRVNALIVLNLYSNSI